MSTGKPRIGRKPDPKNIAKKKPDRPPVGAAPLPKAPRQPPAGRVPAPRSGAPLDYAPRTPRPARVPPQRPVGKVPNPRKPKLVRHVGGGGLNDLFQVFADLPRPPRPHIRVRRPTPSDKRSRR